MRNIRYLVNNIFTSQINNKIFKAMKLILGPPSNVYFENGNIAECGNVAECVRKFRTDFGREKHHQLRMFAILLKEVKETGLIDEPKREKKQCQKVHGQCHQHQYTVVLNK